MTTSSASWYDEVVSQERSFTLESEQGKKLGTVFFVCDVDEQDLKGLVFKPTGYHPSPDDARQLAQAGLSRQTIGFMGELGGTDEVNNSEERDERDEASGSDGMDRQDRYIDARLEGIEAKLDARMEAMQRFQEQAEARFQKAEDRFYQVEQRFSGEVSSLHQTINARFDESRRHSTHVAIATIAGVIAAVGLSLTFAAGWVSDQSAWLRDSVSSMEQRTDSPAPPPATLPEREPPPAE